MFDAWVAIFILLVLTWAALFALAFICVQHFRDHTATIKRLQEWIERVLDEMTKPQ